MDFTIFTTLNKVVFGLDMVLYCIVMAIQQAFDMLRRSAYFA